MIRRIALMVLISILAAGLWSQEMMDPGERNVTFRSGDGTMLEGYLALPPGRGIRPAVLMIHEWWGLNRDTELLADALAREGFVVLAADAFRGSVADTPAGAMQQIRNTPGEQIAADLDAAFRYLSSHPRVERGSVASLGFCFGGTQSMRMATRNPDLAAAVIFYGSGPITEASELGVMDRNGPVLGIYGEEDGNIPVADVRRFESAMDSRGSRTP